MTDLYQAVRPKTGYHSLVKFLSRGKWDADAVAKHLMKLLQGYFANWVYVYDETQAIKTSDKQFGLHFFRNHRYQKRNRNQSKFHSGHQFGALGLLCSTVTETILFPVWVNLICPKTKQENGNAVLKRICAHIPSGLMVFAITSTTSRPITADQVRRELGIDWYRPKKLTRGLMVRYLRTLIVRRGIFCDNPSTNQIAQYSTHT